MSDQELNQLNSLIRTCGIKKTQLAASVGISRTTLYLFLRGDFALPVDKLTRLKLNVYNAANVLKSVV